jgi:hypothetical protein
MQHKIYWGKLKPFIEWSLKTWLAPWAYIASVLYHDVFWYPRRGKKPVHEALQSDWGRLFHNWGQNAPDDSGWKELGEAPAGYVKKTGKLLGMGFKILWTCIKEAPEFGTRKRRKKMEQKA